VSEGNGAGERATTADGRVARRERNQQAVLDVVLEMFAEDMMFPSIEQASQRSGLSLRSLYRYFADPAELAEAAIKRNREQAIGLAHLPRIGQGPSNDRLTDFVTMRVRLYEFVGPVYRATVLNAPMVARIRDELLDTRRQFREQFEMHFDAELAVMSSRQRASAVEAGDILTQMDSIELLRRYRNLSVPETRTVLGDGLSSLLRI
jgi:AcrR family transcriptional regulator